MGDKAKSMASQDCRTQKYKQKHALPFATGIKNMRVLDYFDHKLNLPAYSFPLAMVSEGDAIPRVIHQTFATEKLHDSIKKNIEKIKLQNPGWEYVFYSDQDVIKFIKEHYGESVFRHFSRINPIYGAARADLFRYLLMYKLGGVYLDIKSSLSEPLDRILLPGDRYLLSFWDNDSGGSHERWGLHSELNNISRGEFQQWHIVAAPGHPFLRAVIKNVLRNIDVYNPLFHGVGASGVLSLTGPVAYTLAITPLLERNAHRIVGSNVELGFEYSIFESEKGGSHKSLFVNHYTQLNEPIVRIGTLQRVANWGIRFLYKAFGSRRFLNDY